MASDTSRRELDRASDTSRRELDRASDTSRRELDHHEFDPVGTLVLIGIYFAILAAMWLFMYFVEFLDNGPTVVGLL